MIKAKGPGKKPAESKIQANGVYLQCCYNLQYCTDHNVGAGTENHETTASFMLTYKMKQKKTNCIYKTDIFQMVRHECP